jgi:hypothetical protein
MYRVYKNNTCCDLEDVDRIRKDKESEGLMIEMGMKARRPDRSFLVIAQWVEKELLAL